MATIKEYIKYYKGLLFEECDLNINDIILFTELSYMNWTDIVPKNNKIKLYDAASKYFDKNKTKKRYLSTFCKENEDNLKSIYNSKRYRNIYLGNYRKYLDNEKQFGALCIYFDNKVFVSYEGTDNTVVGWKEDFTLGYHFPIISQEYAVKYLNSVITDDDKIVYVGGHSKGGNLAMTAVIYADDNVFDKIKYVYNLDGPGFQEEQTREDNFKRMLTKLKMYVPEDSVVGMLLYSSDKYTVVKSNEKGIKSHNCNTWLCFGSFLEIGKQTNTSIKINRKIKNWYKKYPNDKIEKMIRTFFEILEKNNIKSFHEINAKKLLKLIGEVNYIDEDTKKIYINAIKELIMTK